MNRTLLGCAFVVGLGFAAGVGAQVPPAQEPPRPKPATGTPASQDQARTVTVEGCLMREADVAGIKDDDPDDFVLTSTKMVKGAAPATRAARAKPGDTPTGTSGAAAPMYEVEDIDDETLKKHVGQRVQIDGTFDDLDDDVADIHGSTIRQVPGDCAAK